MASPTKTRIVVAATVIITDSSADGPSPIALPTCQRVAVLKYLPCSAKLLRKICGGGNSFSSAHPSAQHSSQIPPKSPIDKQAHQAFANQSRPAIEANRRDAAAGRDAPAAAPALASRSTTAISGRFVLQLAVEVGIFLDHRLEHGPVDGVTSGLLLDVAHFHHAVGTLKNEVGLAARVDHRRLLALGDLG